MTEQAPREFLDPLGVGTEMEYSHLIARQRDAQGRLRLETPQQGIASVILRNYLPDYIKRTGRDEYAREFGSDGARSYEDCAHPEEARPLVWSVEDAVTQFIGGQEKMVDIYANAARPLREGKRPFIDGFALSLRLVSSQGVTWGHHQSLLMKRKAISDPGSYRRTQWDRFELLAARLATSYYADGSGGFYLGAFHNGQKSATLGCDFDTHTQSKDHDRESKPLVNQRDSELADQRKYFRLHVVSQDALILPKASFRQIGSTMLTALAIQEGIRFDATMRPNDAYYKVAHIVSNDLSMKRLVRLRNGRMVHPLDIEESVIKSVRQLEDRLNPELSLALTVWQDVHQRMRTVRKAGQGKMGIDAVEAVHNAAAELLPDVVRARKLFYMHRDYEKNPSKYGNIRTYGDLLQTNRWHGVDGLYDRIDTSKSLGLNDRHMPEHAAFMPTREQIEAAKTGESLAGRAAQIRRFILAHANADNTAVGWGFVDILSKTRFNLYEPADTDAALEEHLAKEERAQAFVRNP